MTTFYNHQKLEKKWQQRWVESDQYKIKDCRGKKQYILDMFPYPSGEGLHVGHVEPYTATDIVSRYLRMNGYNVLRPQGFDAFGLPAENYAIETGVHPAKTTQKAIENFKRQLNLVGLSYDWSREVNTSSPDYYKWTQWLFLQLYKKGLAYRKKAPVNWCQSCKTVLANEQVINGQCERCQSAVILKDLEQWFFKITDYAEELLERIDELDWSEALKSTQRNWIGKSGGALIKFQVTSSKKQTNSKYQNSNKIVLIHGKDTTPQGKEWYVWLKDLAKNQNIQFIAPKLPKADNPVLKEWLAEIEKVNPDENTILIGHSRGGVAILRWLERASENTKIKKLILVAANKGDSKKGGDFFTEGKFNYEKIKKHCDDFVVLHSKDDEWVDFEAGLENTKGLNAKFYQFNDRGHFGRKVVDIPELEEELSSIINHQSSIDVFTTRPDTLFGATYLVLSPEHEIISNLKSEISNWEEVEKYIQKSKTKNRLERVDLAKEKTGVELKGIKAINPADQKEISIWVADYVMMDYGTGAIMAVPAHDVRDFEFAKKYSLEIKQVIAPFFTTLEGPDAVRLDRPTIKRQTTYSFVKHWQEDKYLCLDWGKYNWHSGIIGGVKDGEDIIEAARREIQEETGYKNVRFVKELCGEHHCHFFAGHKDENRYAIGHCFLFELIDGAYEKPNPKETKNHKAVWVDKDKMSEFLNLPNFEFIWQQYQKNIDCYTGEGKLINSDKFDGLLSEKARDKITKFVKGQRYVQYKLRDWLISRQRYWGAPIPIIYCDNCKDKEQVLILHGWEDSSKSGFIPSLKNNLESKGYEVFAFDAPNTAAPKFEEWFSSIEKKIKENKLKNFHIVGHSMGGHLAFKLAEKYQVKNLVAVAPVGFSPSDSYFKQFKNRLSDEEITIFKKYQNRDLNIDSVKSNVGEIKFIFGAKDPWITEEIRKYYFDNFSGDSVKVLAESAHMSESEGVKKLAYLENLFPKVAPAIIPVPVEDLPVRLPTDVDFKPTGESPLVRSKSFHNVKCPKCGAQARRESDTMDTFVCSSWYFLRYCDPHNQKEPFSKKKVKYWMPVDLYIGGMEHAVGHLLYARFITKVLRDLGYLKFDEPFLKIRNQGIILAEDSRKMSKRWGNVINPDDVIEEYGADTLRMYEMFMGPLADAKPWSQQGIIGIRRFLEKVFKYVLSFKNQDSSIKEAKSSKLKVQSDEIERLLHKTIKKVTEDIEGLRFNTAISAMMIFINQVSSFPGPLRASGAGKFQVSGQVLEKFLIILAPFAPHLAEELWLSLGHQESIFREEWPVYDKKLVIDEEVIIAVQVNGKLRETIRVERGISESDLRSKIEDLSKVKKYIEGRKVKKFIYIKDKLVNIVT